MEVTREQVEGWVREQREKHGLYRFVVESTEYNNGARYTVHKGAGLCEAAVSPWDKIQHLLKKPWQIPPVGYRLVTQEEIYKYAVPESLMWITRFDKDDSWETHILPIWARNVGRFNFAVPEDYVFEKAVKEISAEEAMLLLADMHGCEVKLTK